MLFKAIQPFVIFNSASNVFQLNGTKFVPVGFNAYWLGYTEKYAYPTNSQISEMFKAAKKMEATIIRSHTLGFSSGSSGSLRPNSNTLNNAAWKSIDYAFYQAKIYGIKLVCPLTDAYNYYHGNFGDFSKTRNVNKNDFWTDLNVRNDFKQYISDWLNHVNSYTKVAIKDSPELFIIELGNELGNIRNGAGSTSLPTYEWINDITNFIKSIDSNHLVMSGSDECLGSQTSNDFQVGSVDVFSGHFYWGDYSRMDYGANGAKSKGKSYIIGEYASTFGQDWFNAIESKPNVKGSIFWSMYPHGNGLPSGNRISHNDGFTMWYDSKSLPQLLLISNHFRRMRNLPVVNTLSFN
jgi:mannan endo-1,4-beta-mannosidase